MSEELDPKEALKRRTKAFASRAVRLFVALNRNREELRIVGRQFLRSATSVAANYREASRARSREEFVAKVELCTQEADESQLWLELLRDDCAAPALATDPLWKEADELIAIFVTVAKRVKEKPRV